MDSWMLTPEERAKAVNDDFYHSHEAVAQAQADKMIRAGFKSPEECGRCTDTSEFAKVAVKVARQEALREAVKRFDDKREMGLAMGTTRLTMESALSVIEQLRAESGRMPEDKS